MAHTLCMLDKQGYTHAPTRTRVHTHTEKKCNIYCLLTATVIRERPLVLRYTFAACLVITEKDSVYCAVRTESLNVMQFELSL